MRAFFIAAALFSLLAPGRAAVWIVDQFGNGHFTDLPQAVSAAAPGDTLLVRWGTYSGTRITRGLKIDAMQMGYAASLRSPLVIEGVPAAERVVVQGLHLGGALTSPNTGLVIVRNCAGAVQIEGSDSNTTFWSQPSSSNPALRVEGSQRVIVRGCTFAGFQNSSPQQVPAAIFSASTVLMYQCELRGGSGSQCRGERGGLALDARGCSLLLSGCRITGGSGSSGYCTAPPFCYVGSGGDAIAAAGSRVWSFGSAIEGGYDGLWSCIVGQPPAQTGRAWASAPAALYIDPETLPALALSAPLAMGTTPSLELMLATANPQVVVMSFSHLAMEFPGLSGVLWIDPRVAYVVGATSSAVGPTVIPFLVERDPIAYGFELQFQAIDLRGRLGACTSGVIR